MKVNFKYLLMLLCVFVININAVGAIKLNYYDIFHSITDENGNNYTWTNGTTSEDHITFKYTQDGTAIYCLDPKNESLAAQGQEMNKTATYTNKGFACGLIKASKILGTTDFSGLNNGSSTTTENRRKYAVIQQQLWNYYGNENATCESDRIASTIPYTGKLDASVDNTTLSLNNAGTVYTSAKITVAKENLVGAGYTLNMSGAPSGTWISTESGCTSNSDECDAVSVNNNQKISETELYINIPYNKLTSNATITLSFGGNYLKSETTYLNATVDKYEYGEFQDMGLIGTISPDVDKVYEPLSDNITFTAKVTSASLTITKKDAKTNKAITGAKFKIYKDGEEAKYLNGNLVGEVTVTNGAVTIDNLPACSDSTTKCYTIKETKVLEGYIDEKSSQSVNLSAGKTSTVDFKNKPVIITIKKTDLATSELLPGAVLEIQDANGNVVKYCKDSSGKQIECRWTSTDKAYEIVTFPNGKYYLVETTAPNGYTIAEKVEFVVDGTKNVTVTMKNALTRVKIIKIEEGKHEGLAGAELELWDSDDNLVDPCLINGKLTSPCKWTSTKEAVEITGLLSGDYWIVETKAPENYVLADDIEFTIDEDGKTLDSDGKEVKTEIEVINTLPLIKILKINAETKKPLAGAKLRIIDEAENVLYEWTSTEDFYEIDPLPYGTYYVVEVSAPKGYALSDKKEKFEINDSTKFIKIMFENNKDYDVPDTLSSKSALLIAFAMLNIGLGIGIVIYVKKNKVTE